MKNQIGWQDIFNTNHSNYTINSAAWKARECGYRFFLLEWENLSSKRELAVGR